MEMGMEDRGSSVKKTLRSLCLSNGWSYGVFWRFDPRNHMLLSMEDAYYEQHAGSVVDNMLLQVHMLGEGIIGEAALEGKHKWMFVDNSTGKRKFVDHRKGKFASWDDSESCLQILSGIKTVAVIPVESQGVVQFGSTKEIMEASEFLDQARSFLLDKDNFVGVASAGSASSSLNSSATGENGLFAPLISSQTTFHGDLSTSWANMVEDMRSCSPFDPLLSFTGETFDEKNRDGELIIDPNFGSLFEDVLCEDRPNGQVDTFGEHFEPALFPASSFNQCPMDDLSQWFTDSSKLCVNGLDAVVSDDISHTLGADPVSSGLGGSDIFSNIQEKQSASSSQSTLSNAFNSFGEGKPVDAPSNNAKLLAEFGIDFSCGKLEDVINAAGDKANPFPIDTGMSISECISGVEGVSAAAPRKGLFSELGLEHLLSEASSSSSITKSCIDDQWPSSKRRRMETYPTINQIQLSGHSLGGTLIHPTSNSGLKECIPKSQAGLWIDESYSMDAKSCISGVKTQTRTPEEPVKATKKRARPGESTRPRPKDRQMIADRLKELRDLIPNGTKLSIDALLGRTVKHMLFMQSLTKHADKLKQVDEPKLIGQDNGMVRKGSSTSTVSGGSGSRGATWAFEVGGTNLFCPIIVEDLSHPGQMLIEMLCEERGYFLEIADVVRGFGLTILKGVMEMRDNKIWAHFVVEGNRHVTRMDVFVSLMQLLQGTSTSEVNITNEPGKVVHDGAPLWSNYQQHVVPLPI